MANPVMVEVLRGRLVESRHRGAAAVCDAEGGTVLALGDVERPVFPRSAVKAIQALVLVESGAADAYGFDDRMLALACASHTGEPLHMETVKAMLAPAGLDGAALECGAHWPYDEKAMRALARAGTRPSALHNNCSGKHAGFLCACRHLGIAHRGYAGRGHAFQEMVREAVAAVTGVAHDEDNCGVDGCSIPTYAVPLTHLARGFARMATGAGLGRERGAAARRIMAACMAEPFFASGTGKADLRMMQAGGGRVFTKVGAEGVFCAALPELGLGIALKCDDGTPRAAEAMVAALLGRLLKGDERLSAVFRDMAGPALFNWNGVEVGEIRPAGPLTDWS